MLLADALFYVFAVFVLERLYRVVIQWRLRMRTGGAAPSQTQPWWDPYGLGALWGATRLSTNMRNYEHFRGMIEAGGPTMMAEILGSKTVITVEPENIKAILATQFDQYGKGQKFTSAFRDFLGNGIFNTDGPIWKHSRAMLRPQFLRTRIADLEIMQQHTSVLLDQIAAHEITDFYDLAFKMTLDTATDYLFGESTGTLEGSSKNGNFAGTFAAVQELQTKRMTYGPLWKLVGFGSHINDLDNFVDQYVQQTLSKPVNDDKFDADTASFLDVLAQDTRDPVVLRDQVISTLLAGRDTTAATLSWLLKHLSNDAARYAKLRAEVLEHLGTDTKATYHQLKNMPYLNACIDETLRLYPIVPMNIREALVDTTLPRGGGRDGTQPMAVAQGTVIWYIPLVMHRMQDLPDVLEWQPERWNGWSPKPWTYIRKRYVSV